MKLKLSYGVVALGLSLFSPACMNGRQPETSPTERSATSGVRPICAAIQSAEKLLRESRLDWGETRAVLRTGSNWYRLEYARDSLGRERVVLVNPANNEAEFPLPR